MPPNDSDHTYDRDALERRLDAVERALADDEPLERADRLVWQSRRGRNEIGESSVPIRVAGSIRIAERTRLRLSYVRTGGEAVVRVEQAPAV